MESPQNIIFLYSKYSTHCQKIYENITKYSLSFVNTLCIDNKKTRERIKKSIYQIKFVPCVLLIYPQGNVEKFEGDQALKWFDEIIKNIIKKKEEEEEQRQQSLLRQKEEELRMQEELLRQREEQLKKQEAEKEKDTYQPQSLSNSSRPMPIPQGQGGVNFTSIDSLIGDSSDKLLDLDTFDESVKKKINNNSILSRAAELQKERDSK
jgi:hypothetical protein